MVEEKPVGVTEVSEADPILAALVARKYVHGNCHTMGGTVSVPAGFALPSHWDLPSRLFRSPVSLWRVSPAGPWQLTVPHPMLMDHPFVQHLQQDVGLAVRPETPDDHWTGWGCAHQAQWWHAVDLIIERKWQELLNTERFTTPKNIFNAMVFGLQHSGSGDDGRKKSPLLSVGAARAMLKRLDADEPEPPVGALRDLDPPSFVSKDGKSGSWPVQRGKGAVADAVWAIVYGIEAGWMRYMPSGFLDWTEAGRSVYDAGDTGACETVTVETEDGQLAFAF